MKNYLIYAKEGCPFCDKLLGYMKESDMRFTYILMFDQTKVSFIKDKYNWETVPIVIEVEDNNGREKLIGGCDDTIKYFGRKITGDIIIPSGG